MQLIMDAIIRFFNSPFITLIGGLATLYMIGSFLYVAFLIIKGVIPIWYRLGRGLATSTIAIFSLNDDFASLKNMLIDSKIFKRKNILQIIHKDIKKAKKSHIFLVHWQDFKNQIDEILRLKEDNTALIIYAPTSEERIEDEAMKKINENRNSVVVNFRGRLINDILLSLITANYGK